MKFIRFTKINSQVSYMPYNQANLKSVLRINKRDADRYKGTIEVIEADADKAGNPIEDTIDVLELVQKPTLNPLMTKVLAQSEQKDAEIEALKAKIAEMSGGGEGAVTPKPARVKKDKSE